MTRTGGITETHVELVRASVEQIPPGSVTTYGELARHCGLSNPRFVGTILRTDGHDVPWYRVIRADGKLASPNAREQEALLRAEGVTVVDRRVDMRRHIHYFDE
ncbi:MGMT family protein [Hoyosella rhizosphaerae]|uniref:DNA methyltransferase n=1 Tax=Hoyosella rhizosphaerae TaxID=1755582 RepID=A0A916UB74_9ACTN|nr:MGMT family protein [Hoyosella rhizosphaerae]MBN4925958.1 MGMT family protein [Hoyosella rhizosphaerae]GGC66632.1 DNA methyltransferase [Hoyosella rhizosphaerae]